MMSEIPADRIEVLPAADEVHADALKDTEVVRARTLECWINGVRPAILHYGMRPKAWHRHAWARIRRDAYVQLFPRVVCADDVTVRVEPSELPIWLRPGIDGWTSMTVLDAAHRARERHRPAVTSILDLSNRTKRGLLRVR